MIDYSLGFLEGVKSGKKAFLKSLGEQTIQAMKEFVDSNARINPDALHHVYEWYQVGSPDARLFDIEYTVSNLGLSLKSTLSQSTSIQAGSTTPFYDKARIMEEGIPVRIVPRKAKALSFEVDGEQVFTKGEVYIDNPGGTQVQGSLERTLDMFMNQYFTQAFLYNIGIDKYFNNTSVFKKNFAAGVRRGKSVGMETGYRWIVNASKGDL